VVSLGVRGRYPRCGGLLFLLGDAQVIVFGRANKAVRADAARAGGRTCGHRPVQSLVLRLSEPVDSGGGRGGEVAVLNDARRRMKLEPRATAAGVRLIAHEVLGSTNAEALRLAREGGHGPLWVTAERQTAGRGRRGRAWISSTGNLHASLLLTEPTAAEHWPQLSFVAALAAHDAVVEAEADLNRLLGIKWPNDLLLAGAKLGGILIEGESGISAVAVGIGVNCASHPTETDFPATDLAPAGAPVSPATLFGALS